MATIGQQLLQPEEGWKRIDGDTPMINYIGTGWWVHNHTGYYYGGDNVNSTQKTKLEFCFYGTKLRIFGYSDPLRSDLVAITIDGQRETFSMNATGSSSVFQTLYYEKEGLEKKIHKVVLEDVGTRFSMDFDCIDIDEDGDLIRYDYFDNPDRKDLIRKYGLSWLGFDENNGNTFDLLGGGFEGVNNGGVRIEGWNGKGSALQLNGNQYMTVANVPTHMTPRSDFSIRFKIRFRNFTTAQRIISTAIGGRYSGLIITIDGGNQLAVYNCVGSSITTIGRYTDLVINKWYDFVISFGDDVRIIVNEEDEVIYKSKVVFTHYTVTHIGVEPGNTLRLLGDIDDLQVFGKALKLEDLQLAKTYIETEEGKNITIPFKKGRVRELTDSGLAYEWREIDEALNEDEIDFTSPTTEYEVTSNTYTNLGEGKMFTLPISDFKTIKIEGNGQYK